MNLPNLKRRLAILAMFTKGERISVRAFVKTLIFAASAALVALTVGPVVRETLRLPHDDARLYFTLAFMLVILLTVFANLRSISAVVGDGACEAVAHLIRTRKRNK